MRGRQPGVSWGDKASMRWRWPPLEMKRDSTGGVPETRLCAGRVSSSADAAGALRLIPIYTLGF